MTLTCTMKEGSKRDVRIPIDPPLSGYEDVKPRLLEMKAFAQEGLGMVRYNRQPRAVYCNNIPLNFEQIKAPKITTFELPGRAYITGSICTVILYLHFIQPLFQPLSLPFFISGNVQCAALKYSAWFIIVTHALESLYTFNLCWKHSTGFLVGVSTSPILTSTFWIMMVSVSHCMSCQHGSVGCQFGEI